MTSQKTAQDVMEGEDKIVESMRRFANDAKCVEYLRDFKGEAESKISQYRASLSAHMQDELTERALKQLQSIAAFEAGMGAAMQELVVKEAGASFKDKFPTDKEMQGKAFSSAVKILAGESTTSTDCPVTSHFEGAFASLQGVDLSTIKGDAKGSLAERVAFAQQAKDAEFRQTFMVTAQEAAEVKSLASKAKSGDSYDFSKLTADATQRLDTLYASINAKVGYSMPDLSPKPVPLTSDSAANVYIEKVNAQLASASAALRDARLKAFVSAF